MSTTDASQIDDALRAEPRHHFPENTDFLRKRRVMPGKLSEVNHQIVRMKVRRIINAAFQVFDDLPLRCSRFRKTRGVTVVLIGFHSAGLQLASNAAGLRIQVKVGGLFNMVSSDHYLIHSGLLHRVDRAADLRRFF